MRAQLAGERRGVTAGRRSSWLVSVLTPCASCLSSLSLTFSFSLFPYQSTLFQTISVRRKLNKRKMNNFFWIPQSTDITGRTVTPNLAETREHKASPPSQGTSPQPEPVPEEELQYQYQRKHIAGGSVGRVGECRVPGGILGEPCTCVYLQKPQQILRAKMEEKSPHASASRGQSGGRGAGNVASKK